MMVSSLHIALVLFGLLGESLVAAFDQEEQNRNANCDNGCFFGSFPGGSCTNDAACMCTQQKYREAYFCCMAQKCASSVLPDSIQRQTTECEARNLPFTFDAEAVCGIKLTTSSTVSASATSTATDNTEASTTSVSATTAASAETTTASAKSTTAFSTSTSGSSSTSASTPIATANSASLKRASLNSGAIIVVAGGIFLL